MTLEDYKDIHKDKSPLEKLLLLMETESTINTCVSKRVDAIWRRNWHEVNRWDNECSAQKQRALWLVSEIQRALSQKESRKFDQDLSDAIANLQIIHIWADMACTERRPLEFGCLRSIARWTADILKKFQAYDPQE